MKTNRISFGGINPFSFSVVHLEETDPYGKNASHIHDQCEIYVNGSGDVSFMVEGQLYPVERGNAIITRPFEYHHCVYHSDAPHEHYWILFSAAGNEGLLAPFFDRPAGAGNRIVTAQPEKLLKLCERLTESRSPLEQYRDFFTLISLLQNGEAPADAPLPDNLQCILEQINRSFTAPLQIEELAKEHFISVNTLERQFKTYFGVTPSEYLRQKRLAHAAILLREGLSVSSAAEQSGFAEPSRFIYHFKNRFGKTPLQYKKEASQ
ncbi:MAG: helix-turn-helix transcriptional regulator [Clostridia bacterium]|nr:helix-turn-helix transcriptional regulator [Clostridia bacterium]